MKHYSLIFAFTLINCLLSIGQSSKQSAALPQYISSYIKLKDVMYSSKIANIKLAAKAMKDKLSLKEITDQKKTESIQTSLDAIISATDLTIQRLAFAKLSQYMISVVEANPVTGITIYSDYCSMARDGKGAYWLSLDKEVKNNPYMGSSMPYCGTVDQKISK